MKYDFAGRLTFAQFGMGIGTGNQNMRVYEETLEYDGFSMLAERETNHWENQAGFNEVHVNGRISQFVGAYDAAGNVLGQLIDGMPEGSGLNTYDAAGRRTRYFEQRMGHYNGYLNMVQEHVTEYDFDGDGRPIVEKDNQRTYHQNSPPSGELEAVPQVYQIWSSVLGTSLVTLGGAAGGGTKIFAGGAVIGYFSSSAGSRWTTADPVTGTTVRWTGSNGAWEKETEQTEPLGQMISNYDPDLEGDPTYETAARNAGFPQWQCSLPDSFWGENPEDRFQAMPFECQMRVLQDLSAGLDEIYGFSNPNNEPDPANVDPEAVPLDDPAGPSPGAMLATWAVQSTKKPPYSPSRLKPGGRKAKPIPAADILATVDVSYIPGYVDASESGVDPDPPPRRLTTAEVAKIAADMSLILDSSTNCKALINNVLKAAEREDNPIVSTNLVDVFWAVALQSDGIFERGFTDRGAQTDGNMFKRTAMIELGVRNFELPFKDVSRGAQTRYRRDQELLRALDAINESMHQAGAFTYNDRDLAIALAEVKEIETPKYGWKTQQDVLNWSMWFHSNFERDCNIQNVKNVKR